MNLLLIFFSCFVKTAAAAISPQPGLTNAQYGHTLDSATLASESTNPELKDTPGIHRHVHTVLYLIFFLSLFVDLAPLVLAKFDVKDVQPFPRPTSSPSADSKECIFFLSHRGPDTKEALVRPLSFILDKLGVPHFFDQSDDAMKLGKMNYEQMAEATWSCRVGVVVLSDAFCKSSWCLKELNTFLLRRHQEPPSKFILLPIYYNPYLLSTDPLYYPVIGPISSLVRKNEEAAHEFLVSMVPRLMTVPNIEHLPTTEKTRTQITEDPFLVKRFWNEFVQGSIMEKAEHKLFADPNVPRAVDEHTVDLERIKTLHKNLTPTDIKAGLEVYQPLEYSLVPPSSEVTRYGLESVMLNLLEHKLVTLGATQPSQDEDEKHAPLRRTSTIGSTIAPSQPFQVLLIQGAAVLANPCSDGTYVVGITLGTTSFQPCRFLSRFRGFVTSLSLPVIPASSCPPISQTSLA
jgi:hypothetical protein